MIASRNSLPQSFLQRWIFAPRSLMLADQALFSITNFILTIVLARTYTPAEFGSYGIALSLVLTVQFVQRNWYVVTLSLMSERVFRRKASGILAQHIYVSASVIGFMALATLCIWRGGGAPGIVDVLVAALASTVIYFQADFDRAILVKSGRFAGAMLLSLVYLAIVVALALLARATAMSFDTFSLLLALGCLLKAGWIALLRLPPHWRWGARFLARSWPVYGVPAALQGAIAAGCTHVPVVVLGAIRGPTEVAGLIAMRSLTQPLAVILRSLDVVDKNRFRSLAAGTMSGARRAFWRVFLSYGALGVVVVVLLGSFANPLIRLIYHGRYIGLAPMLMYWGIYTALLGLMLPLQSVTYLLGKQMAQTRWTTISALVATGVALLGCKKWGAWGAMAATLSAAILNVLISGLVVRTLTLGSSESRLPREVGGGRRLAPAAPRPMTEVARPKRVMLITEEVPRKGVNGALTYLHHFVRYCADRNLQLTILITGHRFARLVLPAAGVFPGRVRLIGPHFVRIGSVAVVMGWRSWRHLAFSWLMRQRLGALRRAALRIRSASQRHATLIGRWLEAHDLRGLAAIIRAEQPEIMLINTLFATPILEARPPGTRAAVITHDVLHQRTRALEARGFRVRPAVAEHEERQMLQRFDAIIAISATDATELRRLAPGVPTAVVMPAVELSVAARNPNPLQCVFLGSGSAQNVDAALWFLKFVWPLVLAIEPRARLQLVGGVCDGVGGGEPGVIRCNHVADLTDTLARASFAICPLRAGSGLKIKMLDYFSHGLATITSSVGAEGFPRNGAEPFLICDEAERFAEAVLAWLLEPAEVARYAVRCESYVRMFSSAAMFDALDAVLGVDGGSRPAC